MSLLLSLLRKDLLRAWRNPVPYLLHLVIPLMMTGMMGLIFGGASRGDTTALGRIKLAIVDEDDSSVTHFLRGLLNQREGARYLEPVFLSRSEAEFQLRENRLSAMVVLPNGFASDYLHGRKRVEIELVKNPAQSFHPAIVEEMLGALVTAMNAAARTLRPEMAQWQALAERSDRPSPREVATLVQATGDRLEAVRDYLFPPLVAYTKAGPAATPGGTGEPTRSAFGLFAYLLVGMSAMFLLFVADTAMRDLYREVRFRTFERFRTLRHQLFRFVLSKVLFALVILGLSSAILLGGGGLAFGIRWEHPTALAVLAGAFAFFAAGLMSFTAALLGNERRTDVFSPLVGMAMGLLGGCMFPPDQLPGWIRNYVLPFMPTHWFADAARSLQGSGSFPWTTAALLLTVCGLCLVVAASAWFRRRLERGIAS